MAETWESLFKKQAQAEGHSHPFIEECLKYRTELSAKNMPVIYDIKHLATLIGWSVNGLNYVLCFIDEHYTTYEIRKKGKAGGMREITAPSATMKQAQWWVYRRLLMKDERVSKYAQGFMERRSIKTNAIPH